MTNLDLNKYRHLLKQIQKDVSIVSPENMQSELFASNTFLNHPSVQYIIKHKYILAGVLACCFIYYLYHKRTNKRTVYNTLEQLNNEIHFDEMSNEITLDKDNED